jgi:hypothetical protein
MKSDEVGTTLKHPETINLPSPIAENTNDKKNSKNRLYPQDFYRLEMFPIMARFFGKSRNFFSLKVHRPKKIAFFETSPIFWQCYQHYFGGQA